MNDVEQTIIDAAIQLFSEKGYAATSIRDIAKSVDMTSASLYYYMDNKKDLLDLIMSRYLKKLITQAEQTLQDASNSTTTEQLQQLIKQHVKSHGKERLAALVVDTEYRSLEGDSKEKIRSMRITYEKLWSDILNQGKQAGDFHYENNKITSYALISLCSGVAHWYREDGALSINEVADHYAEMGLKMVAANEN